ncbi:MAG TPA: N-acetylmuramoyl-L-alanine amidase [Methylomusa anaerophila]|uniref:N-acetylmuramoyl-L-alanine amidase LytC n=1 Tax=Methylomusa anaerophila TaxID=1930071 RepID=A0A348AHG1_9FIRM|nr:N-acetylmuramoyl-L-alanine amidase [Methylomusa anaerophila]BBB90509.1 N-acetylmuramoyl-L-alanine amidase LytC precursor [Methylomusa anaerophila]HML89851.1 N-acetylmuramoyl-L-alanine amidase [Methylomusa anaerophila]
MKITVNPGHYPGLDPGAINPETGLQEATVNQQVGEKLASRLKNYGHDVLLIQRNELYEITDESNTWGAELFISLHCNSFTSSEAHGTETYHFPDSEKGSKLASLIQAEFIGSLGLADRGVKAANFYVLHYTDCPAVLLEMAFITNQEEAALLENQDWQGKAADAIAAAFQRYIQGAGADETAGLKDPAGNNGKQVETTDSHDLES